MIYYNMTMYPMIRMIFSY